VDRNSSIDFPSLPPHNCETRQPSIIAFSNHQFKERRFLLGLKARVSVPNI
jgi:hypothetical protein